MMLVLSLLLCVTVYGFGAADDFVSNLMFRDLHISTIAHFQKIPKRFDHVGTYKECCSVSFSN